MVSRVCGCLQCCSGAQALAAVTYASVLPIEWDPGGATRPLVRMFRPPGLVRSQKMNIYRRKTSEFLSLRRESALCAFALLGLSHIEHLNVKGKQC
jgi:hypothetical protein